MEGKDKVTVILPVLIKEPWQLEMTNNCIRTMRCTTAKPFELIVVVSARTPKEYLPRIEPVDLLISVAVEAQCQAGSHIELPIEADTYVKEFNEALRHAGGDYIVHIGNDVLVRPGWLEALLSCFNITDCGAATLASGDLRNAPFLKPLYGKKGISEGIYCPIMMFERGWTFDEEFITYSDTDLVMRIYESGKRMYRNFAVEVEHLNKQTWKDEDHAEIDNHCKQLFINKHVTVGGHLLIYRALVEGWVI